MLEQPKKTTKILVIDDEDMNRRLMSGMLVTEGYEIILAENGSEALEIAAKTQPDVILLDVIMPGLSGLEVCKKLKADPVTSSIPVLLVTSLHERESRLNGMSAGANDFVTKPVDKEDLRLRVRNAAYTKRLYDEMQSNYEKLKELEKTREILIHMIVHDLRTPLTGVSGYLQLIPKGMLEPKYAQFLAKSLSIITTLSEMINTLLDVSRLEEDKLPINKERGDIKILIHNAIETMGAFDNKCSFVFKEPGFPVIISCDLDIIRRVLINLIGNAVKFSPQDGVITIMIESAPEIITIRVTDNGYGIAQEYHDKIFDKYGQIELHKQKQLPSTGLGLTFCRLAVEAHNGKIGVTSEPQKGSTFWFTLPIMG